MKYITVKLTLDQAQLIVDLVQADILPDDYKEARAFRQRIIDKIDKASLEHIEAIK